MNAIEIIVRRSGREIDRVVTAIRQVDGQPAVKYRGHHWPVTGDSIDLDGSPLEEGTQPASPVLRSISENSDQDAVLAFRPEGRLLVDAGPGTGKTHTACGKIAALVNDGIPAPKICVISFTRTAVAELRSRIAEFLADPADAAAIRIATLDSHAWSLQSGFSSDAHLSGSYDEGIDATLKAIRGNEEVSEYLGRVRHLIIDEAQDIVGSRAELVCALITSLDPDCGVTVFADEAQAIYGFTEDDTHATDDTLLSRLIESGFERLSLSKVRRTSCPRLREIFTTVRQSAIARTRKSAIARYEGVRHNILKYAHGEAGTFKDLSLASLRPDALVLSRRRAEVLTLSGYNAGVPHRLRMSGLPAAVAPWVATLFWDYSERRISMDTFTEVWTQRMEAAGASSPVEAWDQLVSFAGVRADLVDMHRLREVLSRSNPPVEYCMPDFGTEGPIIGTIHASKGREARDVYLFLPDEETEATDEETRVMFVGATRAREQLFVGTVPDHHAGSSEGRVWKWYKPGGIKVEVGRSTDLNAEGLAGLDAFSSSDEAVAAQALWKAAPRHMHLCAATRVEAGWNYVLIDAEKRKLAVLSAAFRNDMRNLATHCGCWPPPGFLPHINSFGLRTMAIAADSPTLDRLHEPWRSSGFVTAPLLSGFSPTKVQKKA